PPPARPPRAARARPARGRPPRARGGGGAVSGGGGAGRAPPPPPGAGGGGGGPPRPPPRGTGGGSPASRRLHGVRGRRAGVRLLALGGGVRRGLAGGVASAQVRRPARAGPAARRPGCRAVRSLAPRRDRRDRPCAARRRSGTG